MIDKSITLEKLLNEAKERIGKIEKGQVYETMVSIYPKDNVPSSEKNVIVNDVKMTLPLASSSRAKREYNKSGCSLKEIFKEGAKGDYLLVEDVAGDDIICRNISISKDKYDTLYKYPSMKKVTITKDDIVNGNVKRVYRGYKTHLD